MSPQKQMPLLFFPLVLSTLLSTLSNAAFASETKDKGLSFSNAKIMAPLKGTNVTAGFVKIENKSEVPVELKLVEVKPFKMVELHETFQNDGKMGMRMIEKVILSPKDILELKPGGHHLMLFDATRDLRVGEKIKVMLLANKKPLVIPFIVETREGSNTHEH